jgi:ABC-type glycerol-3-phosphate transport system substrate-binding protein
MSMKFTTRALAATAAVAAAALTLSGCAISSDTSAGGDKVLTVWTYYTGPGQLAALKAQDAIFEKNNPGWTVKEVQVPGDQFDQKLLATASTGNGPDVELNNVVVDFPSLVGAGVLKDLTPEWNAYADKNLFPASAVWKNDGKVYNVMSYTNLIGLYSNTTILNQYGIKAAPTTLDQFESDLAIIKAGGKYQGLAESGSPDVQGAWLFAPLLLAKNVNYCNFTGSDVGSAFSTIGSWAKKGYVPQATATWDQATSWQKFMTGQFAFGINGNWNLGDATANAKFKFTTSQFPSVDGKSVVYPGGEGIGIGAKSKHQAEAWKYVEQAWLSKAGSIADFKASGQIPVRSDVASDPSVKSDTLVAPFIAAAQNSGTWPNNAKTADAQNALGKEVSAVLAGQTSASVGASTAIANITAALKAGGGGC